VVGTVLRPTRLLALGALVLVGILYWKPIHTYEHVRAELRNRDAQVSRLETQKRELTARIATVGSGQELLREARRLGFVKPGEQLFIVRGIAAWRSALAAGH
jgi:cell division protein FtsB